MINIKREETGSESVSDFSYVEHKVTIKGNSSLEKRVEVSFIDQKCPENQEMSLDEYLLGNQQEKEDLSTSRDLEEEKWFSNIEIEKVEKDPSKDKSPFFLNTKIVSNKLLHPLRSNTFAENKPKPRKIGTFWTNK